MHPSGRLAFGSIIGLPLYPQVDTTRSRHAGHLFLRWINDNPIQIRPLRIESIPQPANRNLVVPPFRERQLERSGQDDALVRISLVERLHVLGVTVDDDTADATKLPCASNAVRASSGCEG